MTHCDTTIIRNIENRARDKDFHLWLKLKKKVKAYIFAEMQKSCSTVKKIHFEVYDWLDKILK